MKARSEFDGLEEREREEEEEGGSRAASHGPSPSLVIL